MKYNPVLNESLARLPGFTETHPFQDLEQVQGNLCLMYRLQEWLREIGGFAGLSLQPAAGAQGEFTALLMMRAYHRDRGETQRMKVLIPDAAHGTNPASAAMAGLTIVELPCDTRGNVDQGALRAACDDSVLGLMLTNPNTLGLFEERLDDVAALVHGCGGLLYGDGANMNALVGVAKPALLGFDLMHYEPADAEGGSERYSLANPERSIGRMCAYLGNFGMLVRAYAYIRLHGAEGLRQNSLHAVLNANYLRVRLRDRFPVPFDRVNMHEFVCQGRPPGSEVHAVDVAKRLIDFGFHPPTMYFPLIVPEALLIEPTETESRETLDAFVATLRAIADEATTNPEMLRAAPHSTPVRRLDEVRAARQPLLSEPPTPATSAGDSEN
jgi:glycine dehydrogenase subunit 2